MREHIVINSDRSVTVPDSLKKIGIQYDHNVNTLTFDCPRYADDAQSIDMSKMQIFINWMLPDKSIGCSIAENIIIDEADSTLMHFDWIITSAVTPVFGILERTLVCIKQTDTDGREIYHWNTDLFQKFSVGEGMECNEQLAEENMDVITQLLVKMDAVDTRTSTEAMRSYVSEYMTENPPQPSDEQANAGVDAYMTENGQDYVNTYMGENAQSAVNTYMDVNAQSKVNTYMEENAQEHMDTYMEQNAQNKVDDYLERNPLQLDNTLTDPTKAAPADKVGEIGTEVDELKGDLANKVNTADSISDNIKINNVPHIKTKFADDFTGYYCINTGVKIPTIGITFGTVSIKLFTLALSGYNGTENSVENINVGIYTNNGTVQKQKASVCGAFSGNVGVGIKNNLLYIILGKENYRWIISELTLDSIALRSTGGVFEYTASSDVEKTTNLSGYSSYKILDTDSISVSALDERINDCENDIENINSRVTSLEQSGGETAQSLILAEHRARRLYVRQKLNVYADWFQKYQNMANLIRFGNAEQKMAGNALKAEFEPIKMLFVGDSHTELQYNYVDSRTDLSVGMQGRPCGFSNPNHWAYKLWQIFNPLALNYDGSENDYSSYSGVIKGNAQTQFLKIENGAERITTHGNYEYNRYVDGSWILGSCGGQPLKGEHQFAFFHDVGSYVEFDLPAKRLGFALTFEMFTGTRSNGTISDTAASNVTISIDGTVVDTLDMRVDKQNYKWVGKCPSDDNGATVRVTNVSGGWMAIWGIEFYRDIPVIPINAAISGGTIISLSNAYEKSVASQNPDIVVFEPTICNDEPSMNVYGYYQEYFSKLNTLTSGNVLVMLAPIPNSTVDTGYDLYQQKRLMIYNMANKYRFPIIDLGHYLQSIYGKRLGNVMPDDVHLNDDGNIALHSLLLKSLFFGED